MSWLSDVNFGTQIDNLVQSAHLQQVLEDVVAVEATDTEVWH